MLESKSRKCRVVIMMLQNVLRYWNTVRYMKPSQVFFRFAKIAQMPCTLGVTPKKSLDTISPLQTIAELDFDPVFLARFPLDEVMKDRVTLLYQSENFHWNESWDFSDRTPLWNYNLHYFEYVFPLIKAYKDTGNKMFLEKLKSIVRAWIEQNPKKNGGVGWNSYPTALRLTNWLATYTHLEREFDEDVDFRKTFIYSVWEQYNHLAHHMEKDLLANHYLEDLKALILCALFFGDEKMLKESLSEFRKQCCEQILPDGMHFELSPMYHKLILEDLMRVAVALRGVGRQDAEIESYLQSMLDAAYSLEEGLDRIPLFNDCGNNVTKSLGALCAAAKTHFGLYPYYKDKLPESGYYIFKRGDWKLIVDAGQPGPMYAPGHAQCDAMSFELFKAGKPVIVNCGTYAYQCRERAFFKSTAAHNTVMVDGAEQSQCWSAFRMGKRSKVHIKKVNSDSIEMEMIDQNGAMVTRKITLGSDLSISDCASTRKLESYIHFYNQSAGEVMSEAMRGIEEQLFADEFGKMKKIKTIRLSADNVIEMKYPLQ